MVPTIEEEEDTEQQHQEGCRSKSVAQFQLQNNNNNNNHSFKAADSQSATKQRLVVGQTLETEEQQRNNEARGDKTKEKSLIKIYKTTATQQNDKTSNKKNKLLERASSFAFSRNVNKSIPLSNQTTSTTDDDDGVVKLSKEFHDQRHSSSSSCNFQHVSQQDQAAKGKKKYQQQQQQQQQQFNNSNQSYKSSITEISNRNNNNSSSIQSMIKENNSNHFASPIKNLQSNLTPSLYNKNSSFSFSSSSTSTSTFNSPLSSSNNYISSLVNKSSTLFSSLKQSYNSLTSISASSATVTSTTTTAATTTTSASTTKTVPTTPITMHQSLSTPQQAVKPRPTNEQNAPPNRVPAPQPEQVSKRDNTNGRKLEESADSVPATAPAPASTSARVQVEEVEVDLTTSKVAQSAVITNKGELETKMSSLGTGAEGSKFRGDSASGNGNSSSFEMPVRASNPATKSGNNSCDPNTPLPFQTNKPPKPPLPPPPPMKKEVAQAALGVSFGVSTAAGNSVSQQSPQLQTTILQQTDRFKAGNNVGHLLSSQHQSVGSFVGCASEAAASSVGTNSASSIIQPNPPPIATSVITTTTQASTLSVTQSLGFGVTTTTTPTTNSNSNSNNTTTTTTSTSTQPNLPGSLGISGSRRHALQEQSLERDAALSLKVKDLKHKRTSSIKSALKHAHLGPLRSFNLDKRTFSSSSSSNIKHSSSQSNNNNSSGSGKPVKSMPYELFEPPITQRTFQRTKRRGAMMSDPRRQMSADTIGLRQLTDEYLHNAGVKPMSSSGQCSLVALAAQNPLPIPSSVGVGGNFVAVGCGGVSGGATTTSCGSTGATYGTTNGSCSTSTGSGGTTATTKRTPIIGTYHNSSSTSSTLNHSSQQPLSIETQLYQAGKQHAQAVSLASSSTSRKSSGATLNWSSSQDSLSNVTILPGNLPWQSDVSIQCEILQAPPNEYEMPYETTGDILNTIAGPFKGGQSSLIHANSTSCGSGQGSLDSDRGGGGGGGSHHQLGATLKRGLTAISQHHLTPGSGGPGSSALNVVGSLKKSLSNTLDISHLACGGGNSRTNAAAAAVTSHLHYQDSLPAYSSLLNEPDSDNDDNNNNTRSGDTFRTRTGSNGASATGSQQHPQSNNNSMLDPERDSAGFIGHLTSKLTRQGSKKFSVSKKGLQRALSFDCRGYKRLDHNHPQDQSNESSSSVSAKNLLSTGYKRAHTNKSTLVLNTDLAPRPYLPQSASQVDFQVPLLPYHKMQEAIVSQRLLEPRAPNSTPSKSVDEEMANKNIVAQQDADELLCAQTRYTQDIVEPQCVCLIPGQQNEQHQEQSQHEFEKEQQSSNNSAPNSNHHHHQQQQQAVNNRRPPRLVLDIPTIATPNSDDTQANNNNNSTNNTNQFRSRSSHKILRPPNDNGDDGYDDDGEDANANNSHTDESNRSTLVVCLPSPNISLDPAFNALSNSPSFCIDQNNKSSIDSRNVNQLTASDVFSRSKIKRPSTMVMSDAMNQVAQALNSTNSSQTQNNRQQQQHQQQQGVSVVLRNRRRAIVPPKLATDGSISDSENRDGEAKVGQLVDVDDDHDDEDDENYYNNNNDRSGTIRRNNRRSEQDLTQLNLEDDAALKAFRRKRSGGGTEKTSIQQQQQQQQELNKTNRKSSGQQQDKRPFGSQNAIPTFYIEPSSDKQTSEANTSSAIGRTNESVVRPESQMTNVDSLVSSGSSTNLSISGKNRDFTVTSPGGLTVSFGSSRGRRRSSIAVIPQMQICPGDLLVYSKQLIDRMNQSEETEPPQFLTIDDKKGKNIWSSFKLCAQFDNRTLKARNELLCSLEDVLASLQPSTFVDEQLSHYKGMLWNEFLYETESRRSASSDGLALLTATLTGLDNNNNDDDEDGEDALNTITLTTTKHDNIESTKSCSILRNDDLSNLNEITAAATTNNTPSREPLKVTMSSSGANLSAATSVSNQQTSKTNVAISIALASGATTASAAVSTSTTITTNETTPTSGGHRSRDPTTRSISSRFREKPKLKRGQTVDSVFRIPLIPSSPLKHAQQHQQTPTAHLEQDDLITIEDDERSNSPQSASSRSLSRELSLTRRNRSASTRSRSGSSQNRLAGQTTSGSAAAAAAATTNGNPINQLNDNKHGPIKTSPSAPFPNSPSKSINQQQAVNNQSQDKDQDSSFETDDAMDLIDRDNNNNNGHHSQLGQVKSYNNNNNNSGNNQTRTPHQIIRQSSLSTLSSTITRTEQKRQRALWDLFQSECTFFFDHLMTLKNVYMEPLKKIQVEGFAMFADPDVLFGNLDELCCGVYDFCKEFLYIIMRTLKTRPEELNATDVLIKLYKKNPKIDHLRGVYHRYTLNYINALTYLESLRRQVEFVEFEKWSSRDVRCKKLQLTDLLVAPVQHIMRVPIILKDIESHTENPRDREEIIAILAVEEASLRELDDKMRWLKNFERLLEIQKNISWPSVLELDSKLFVPEFLKEVLSKQPCEKLIVSPRRQIVHEGTLSNLDLGRACDMHVILFDDMLLLTRRKKGLTKKASTVCKTNSGGSSTKDDGSYKYIVYKQPLSLDRFYVHDVQQADAQAAGMKFLFLLIIMNRFQQIINVHSFSAPNDDVKQTWLFKIKKTADRWKKNLSNGSNEQNQFIGGHPFITTSTTIPTTQEPISSYPLTHPDRINPIIKQQIPKVNKPQPATCSD